MPLTVCLWNIQNYGAATAKYSGLGLNNALRNSFIAAFVWRYQIEVMMIMEMQPGQQAALADLVDQLNAYYPQEERDWAYSYCGCAIGNGVDEVLNAGQIINNTGARTEGYAVVWRTRQDNFALVDAPVPIDQGTSAGVTSPLNINQLGRPTGPQWINNVDFEIVALGGFTSNRVFPYQRVGNNYQLMDHWPRLGFPMTGAWDANVPSWTRARRPVYVVARLNDQYRTLAPVMAYHAPSDQARAYWGALMAGLARELYVVDAVDQNGQPTLVTADRGFVGGDFNYAVPEAAWPSGYRYFTAAYARAAIGGAAQQATPSPEAADVDRRTTVQLFGGWPQQPINSGDPDDYLRLAIDLGFNRPIPQINSYRLNLVADVMDNDDGFYDEAMEQAAAYMTFLQNNVVAPDVMVPQTGPYRFQNGEYIPMICGSWGGTFLDWTNALTQYQNHQIVDARCAAEFVHLFISDHLPLISTFDY